MAIRFASQLTVLIVAVTHFFTYCSPHTSSCTRDSSSVSRVSYRGLVDGLPYNDSEFIQPDLRTILSHKLEEIDHIDAVLSAYDSTIRPILNEIEQHDFEQRWLVANIYFLGSQFFDHDQIYGRDNALVLPFIMNRDFQEAYRKFVFQVKSICAGYRFTLPPHVKDTVERVVLLFPGSYGGGHIAPKQAMEQFFTSRNIEVLSIDVDEMEAPYSKNIVGLSRGEVYSEIFQKKGDAAEADRLWCLIEQKLQPEDRRVISDIREKVIAFQPDHMFVLSADDEEFSALSHQLGIPLTFVHTDQYYKEGLTWILLPQRCDRESSPLLTFTTTNDHKEFFPENYLHVHGLEIPKSSSIPPVLQPYAINLGIPVRMQFQPITDEEKKQLRRENGVPEDALVCKLAVGHYGVSKELLTLLRRLVQEQDRFKRPLYVFVLTGANPVLQKEIESELGSSYVVMKNVTFDVKGFMDSDQMALCDKMTDFWITKPGGSTVVEAVQMRKKILYKFLKSHPWEKANCLYLERMNLGSRLRKREPLVDQIYALLEKPIIEENLPLDPWYVRLDRWLAEYRRPVPGNPYLPSS